MQAFKSPIKARRPTTPRSAWRPCYMTVGAVTIIVLLVIFYSWLFRVLKGQKQGQQVLGKIEQWTGTIHQQIHPHSQPAPCANHPIANHYSLAQYGDYPQQHGAGGEDPDAWLDTIADFPPPIVPSHYALVNGEEPFEHKETGPFQLHTIPTDEWYDIAKRATDRCDLTLTNGIQGAGNGLEDKVVWVSGLLDLKRGESGNKEFQRSMDEYYRRFQNILDRGFQMIIYIAPEFEEHLRIDYNRIKVVYMNTTTLRTYFPYYDRLQAIRTSRLWTHQADLTGWLTNAPQARLPEYNPLVMSKIFMLRDAARINPWGARYHMWMDAGHLCAGDQNPTPAGTSMYRRHMATGMLVTHWPYGTETEVHGLTDKAMHLYMAQHEDPLRIVRGGIFGGTLPYIECVIKAYVIALHQTMTDGYVGTEECIWAMIHARFPHLFNSFDNNSLGGHGDNCASFTASKMEENDINAGKKNAFVSPDVPAAIKQNTALRLDSRAKDR